MASAAAALVFHHAVIARSSLSLRSAATRINRSLDAVLSASAMSALAFRSPSVMRRLRFGAGPAVEAEEAGGLLGGVRSILRAFVPPSPSTPPLGAKM